MALIVYALFVIAILLFILAGLSVSPPPRFNSWIGWGLASLTLALVIMIWMRGLAIPH